MESLAISQNQGPRRRFPAAETIVESHRVGAFCEEVVTHIDADGNESVSTGVFEVLESDDPDLQQAANA